MSDLFDKETLMEDYFTLLRFPSISADPAHKDDMLTCCSWVETYIKGAGFNVERWETPGYPCIYASHLEAGDDQPTLLIYGHYDVQPVDPLDEWETPPFEPVERNGEIYARGAQDNKGQLIYTLAALKAMIEKEGRLPINVKLLIEGEEENKSGGLAAILPDRAEELAADYLTAPDFDLPTFDEPAVTLGARGLIAITLELQGSESDLHSGSHGGAVYNPNHALVELLAKLRDSEGRVTLPEFYDDVLPLSDEEKRLYSLIIDEGVYGKGFEPTGGEKKFSPAESVRCRPTLEINGVYGGYSGPGFKTVIPAKAGAKISCRLVANQDPTKIEASLVKFLEENCPPGIKMTITSHGGDRAARTSHTSNIAQAIGKAYTDVLDKPVSYTLSGGSVPIIAAIAETAQADAAFMGFGLADDAIHAPNERFGIDRLELGFKTICSLLGHLATETEPK